MIWLLTTLLLLALTGVSLFALASCRSVSFRAMEERTGRDLTWESERRELIAAFERQLNLQRDEIKALTESLTRAKTQGADMQIVYPRRGPLEPSEGWFDGPSRITKVRTE
jgi:hypothetical protein